MIFTILRDSTIPVLSNVKLELDDWLMTSHAHMSINEDVTSKHIIIETVIDTVAIATQITDEEILKKYLISLVEKTRSKFIVRNLS